MNFLFAFSKLVMPCILVMFACIFMFSKEGLYDSFLEGAKEGMESCKNLLPSLLLVMCGVNALYSSGAVDVLCMIFKPLFDVFKIDEEMLPAIVLRPFSGSGVTAVADRLFRESGADSEVSKTACLLMGTTDTIIYTLGMYFSSAKIERTRYALPASFIVFLFSVFLCTAVGKMVL